MGGWLAVIFIVLVLLGYLFQSIGWLFTHELVWVIVFLSIVGAVILFLVVAAIAAFFSPGKQSSTVQDDVRKARSAGVKADQAIATLRSDRAILERKARELEELRHSTRGSVNFQLLAQRHNESRLLADSWYSHKRQAVLSKKDLSAGIARFNSHASQLTRQSSLQAARSTISQLSTLARTLQSEIDRSGEALDRYNQQTADLRDHIHNTCGLQGAKWYNALEARKAARNGDKE
jgi:hypothetical protein